MVCGIDYHVREGGVSTIFTLNDACLRVRRRMPVCQNSERSRTFMHAGICFIDDTPIFLLKIENGMGGYSIHSMWRWR